MRKTYFFTIFFLCTVCFVPTSVYALGISPAQIEGSSGFQGGDISTEVSLSRKNIDSDVAIQVLIDVPGFSGTVLLDDVVADTIVIPNGIAKIQKTLHITFPEDIPVGEYGGVLTFVETPKRSEVHAQDVQATLVSVSVPIEFSVVEQVEDIRTRDILFNMARTSHHRMVWNIPGTLSFGLFFENYGNTAGTIQDLYITIREKNSEKVVEKHVLHDEQIMAFDINESSRIRTQIEVPTELTEGEYVADIKMFTLSKDTILTFQKSVDVQLYATELSLLHDLIYIGRLYVHWIIGIVCTLLVGILGVWVFFYYNIHHKQKEKRANKKKITGVKKKAKS